MLAPNQIACLNEYYERGCTDVYFCAERHDCDYEQMQQIVAALDPRMPGRGLDYAAILAKDPIASDPLLIQCNQTIGRLDDIYCQMRIMFHASHGEERIHKHTTINKPPDWANPSFSDKEFHFPCTPDGKEKVETTTMPDKQRFKMLETAMKCLDRSLKIQITLTSRREKLQKELLHPKAQQPANPKPAAPAHANSSSHKPLNGHTAMTGLTGMKGMRLTEFISELASEPEALLSEVEIDKLLTLMDEHFEENTHPASTNAHHREEELANELAKELTEEPIALAMSTCTANSVAHSSVDPTTQFGPPKEFTPHPSLEDLHQDRYAWRKDLKAIQQTAKRSRPLAPREEQPAPPHQSVVAPTKPDLPPPAHHQRE